jgi:hypothetical protein
MDDDRAVEREIGIRRKIGAGGAIFVANTVWFLLCAQLAIHFAQNQHSEPTIVLIYVATASAWFVPPLLVFSYFMKKADRKRADERRINIDRANATEAEL